MYFSIGHKYLYVYLYSHMEYICGITNNINQIAGLALQSTLLCLTEIALPTGLEPL